MQWHEPTAVDFGIEDSESSLTDLRLQEYVGGYGAELSRLVPRRVLTHDVGLERVAVGSGDGRTSWKPLQARVDLWSLGVGMVTVVYQIDAGTLDWDQLLHDLDGKRKALREAASKVAIETGQAVNKRLQPHDREEAWDPLWMYAVLLIRATEGTPEAALNSIAKALSYDGLRAKLLPPRPGAVVRVYFNACAAFVDSEREIAVAAARVTSALNAVWAAAVDYDRVLLNLFPTQASERSATLKQLDEKSTTLLDLYQRVQGFRTLVGTLPVNLGILDMPLWDAVAKKWRLADLLNGLGARFDALDHVNTHLVQAVSDRTARRLNNILLIFTVASVVTLGTAAIQFTQAPLKSPDPTSLEWLGALFLVTADVGLIAWLRIRGGRRW